ncbi:hypothetical protein [Schaalia canis]|uniref:PRTRC system protein E n=1 Tax=Schaalia canis TaxID=100469 RepID=A0A3P1SFS1_9ACTO|nr:hypothetical protein [Schaalia canis]RRC95829.1 hypothetical protein EII11_02885 [Schaalia canis]
MVTERQIPDFPSRRSLHAKGADPHALDEATAMASLPSRTDLPPVPETPPAPETLPAADTHSAVDSGVAVKTGAVGGTGTGEVFPEAEASSARENEVAAPIPERRSMRDRLANTPPVNLDPPSTPLLGVPVGHGAVAAPGDSFVEGMTGAYTMLTEGVFNDELAGTGLVPVVDVISSGSLLDAEKATTHHLFAVSEEVEGDELEALAVSIWDEAQWVEPGRLKLTGDSYLQGPWSIEGELSVSLGLPTHLSRIWILECSTLRGRAPSPELIERDEWARAFPDGLPLGLEHKSLLALARMARRLAGAVRIFGSGVVMMPDPESAVHMAVYSPRWIDPAELLERLLPDFPQIVDSRDIPVEARVAASPREVRRIASVMAGVKPMSEEVAEVLQKAREEAARQPLVVDGYALVSPVAGGGKLTIEVRRVPSPPRVLRWEPWTSGVIVEYRLRWIPSEGVQAIAAALDKDITAEFAFERTVAAVDVEKAAVAVATLTGGSLIDEDGFLIAT